jgi:hypothetical protein
MTIHFTIQKLLDLSNKNKEMTLNENNYLYKCLNILKTYASNILVPEQIAKEYIEDDAFIRNDVLNGITKEYVFVPTEEQSKFIRYILPLYIIHNLNSIKDVLKIYKLDLQMSFAHIE